MRGKDRLEFLGMVALVMLGACVAYACLAWAFVGLVWLPRYALTGSMNTNAFAVAYSGRVIASVGSICIALAGLFAIYQILAFIVVGFWRMLRRVGGY